MTWLRGSLAAAAQAPLFCLLAAFLVTFLLTRGVTCLIRAGRGIFADLSMGALHLHHMLWGVGLVLVCGTYEFAFDPSEPWNVLPAVGFGAGAALVLDEFALMVYLRDVYWSDEGRRSIDAVITMSVLLGMLAIPFALAPGLIPHASRPVFIALAFAYIAAMGVSLLKGKLFTGIAGLFLPPVVLIGAVRLARPGSPWAHVRYRSRPEKQLRATTRYRPASARERHRQRVLDAIGGSLPQLAAASYQPSRMSPESHASSH
jgi:hypothetical protein